MEAILICCEFCHNPHFRLAIRGCHKHFDAREEYLSKEREVIVVCRILHHKQNHSWRVISDTHFWRELSTSDTLLNTCIVLTKTTNRQQSSIPNKIFTLTIKLFIYYGNLFLVPHMGRENCLGQWFPNCRSTHIDGSWLNVWWVSKPHAKPPMITLVMERSDK